MSQIFVIDVFGKQIVTSHQLADSFDMPHPDMCWAIQCVQHGTSHEFFKKNFVVVPVEKKDGSIKVHYMVTRTGFDALIGVAKPLKNTKVIEKYFKAFEAPRLEGGAA